MSELKTSQMKRWERQQAPSDKNQDASDIKEPSLVVCIYSSSYWAVRVRVKLRTWVRRVVNSRLT